MSNIAPYLLIDAGNSRIKWALAAVDGRYLHVGTTRVQEISTRTSMLDSEDNPDWVGLPVPSAAWISNVAGHTVASRINALVDAYWLGLPRTTICAAVRQCGVTNGYAQPHTLGSDRWAGLIGAHEAFPNENLLIATLGTATTLEALHADGRFVGGLIAPGWSLMMRSLGARTAQLPTLDVCNARNLLISNNWPKSFFASDTHRSVSAGCALAQVALIERLWTDLQSEWQMEVRLVISGGAADDVITNTLKIPYTRYDELVLAGLALIAAEDRRR